MASKKPYVRIDRKRFKPFNKCEYIKEKFNKYFKPVLHSTGPIIMSYAAEDIRSTCLVAAYILNKYPVITNSENTGYDFCSTKTPIKDWSV